MWWIWLAHGFSLLQADGQSEPSGGVVEPVKQDLCTAVIIHITKESQPLLLCYRCNNSSKPVWVNLTRQILSNSSTISVSSTEHFLKNNDASKLSRRGAEFVGTFLQTADATWVWENRFCQSAVRPSLRKQFQVRVGVASHRMKWWPESGEYRLVGKSLVSDWYWDKTSGVEEKTPVRTILAGIDRPSWWRL